MNKVLYVLIVFRKVEWFKKRFEECDRNHDGKLQFDGMLTSIFLNNVRKFGFITLLLFIIGRFMSL